MTAAFVVLCLTTSPQALDERLDEHRSFVGFSHNERLAAWRVRVDQQREDGSHDLYTLIEVVDAYTGEQVHVYRGSSIEHGGANGKRAAASKTILIASNPRFADAAPRVQWTRLQRRARFTHKALLMNDSALRLAPDSDTHLTAAATASEITVHGAVGTPVGYNAIARRLEGPLVSLGHFRHAGERGVCVDARVRVFFSRTGYGVAVLSDFVAGGNTPSRRDRHTSQTKVVRLRRAPIATVYIGTLKLAMENLRSANGLYDRLHPGSRKEYDKYITDGW